MSRLLVNVTSFADADVTLPVAAATLVVLALLRRFDLAGAWVVAVGGTLAAILALKLLFGIFVVLGSWMDVASPSGHTVSATIVWGGVALLMIARPRAALAIGTAIAVAIGLTRLGLGAHSVSEVLVGGLVGLLGLAALGRLAGRATPLALRARALLLAAAIAVTALGYGGRARIEGRLDRFEYHAARALGLPIGSAMRRYISFYGAV